MGNFVSLQTGLTGIRAAQAGIDVTSHNVSNANTPGYTRQRSLQAAREPYDSPVGPMGTGVEVQEIQRMRDRFLDTRVRTTSADAAYDGTTAELLGRVEQVMGEPDAGIAVELDNLWASFEDLANEPNVTATRTQVFSALETLAARINSVESAWHDLRTDTRARRNALVGPLDAEGKPTGELNDLLRGVADRNLEAMNPNGRPVAPDSLDERDIMLDRIAEMTGATITYEPDNSVTVRVGSQTLVSGGSATAVRIPADSDTLEFKADSDAGGTWDNLGAENQPAGELGAIQAFVTEKLGEVETQLTTFVSGLQKALNEQHERGFVADSAGATIEGDPLLRYDTAKGPGGRLGVAIGSGADLAAAKADPAQAHDGDNAQELADLRSNASTAAAYREVVVAVGADIASARRSADAKAELGHAAEQARMSMHGVSIDEEMVNLIHYQRAMEAASRVMTTVDEALDVLVNRTGLVGR